MFTLELFAVSITLVAVYLTTRQIVWCWPIGMVSVVLYAIVFGQARLYADMGLQAIYFTLAAYGWWVWLHGGEEHGVLTVSRTSRRAGILLLAIGIVAGFALGQTLHRFTDASLPMLDSTLSSFSIAAQWMQTRKLLEAWLVWLAVDFVYIGMFVYKGLWLTAGLYAVFLYLALLGFREWRRSMPAAAAEPRSRLDS